MSAIKIADLINNTTDKLTSMVDDYNSNPCKIGELNLRSMVTYYNGLVAAYQLVDGNEKDPASLIQVGFIGNAIYITILVTKPKPVCDLTGL